MCMESSQNNLRLNSAKHEVVKCSVGAKTDGVCSLECLPHDGEAGPDSKNRQHLQGWRGFGTPSMKDRGGG